MTRDMEQELQNNCVTLRVVTDHNKGLTRSEITFLQGVNGLWKFLSSCKAVIKVPAVSMSAELLAAVEDKKIAVDMSVWIIEAVTAKKTRHLSRTGLCIELVFNRVGIEHIRHSPFCTYACS